METSHLQFFGESNENNKISLESVESWIMGSIWNVENAYYSESVLLALRKTGEFAKFSQWRTGAREPSSALSMSIELPT